LSAQGIQVVCVFTHLPTSSERPTICMTSVSASAYNHCSGLAHTSAARPARTCTQHSHTVCICYQGRTVPAGCLDGGGSYGRAEFSAQKTARLRTPSTNTRT